MMINDDVLSYKMHRQVINENEYCLMNNYQK